MRPLQEIRRTRLDRVTPEEHFAIELEKFMRDIRASANEVRTTSQQEWQRAHLRYLIGRLHGLWFGSVSFLLWGCGHGVYDECAEMAEAAMNEAEFLAGPYLYPEAA